MKKVLLFIFLIIYFESCKFAEKEIYYIPDHYAGNALIFSNVKNGTPQLYDNNNSRVYSFNSGGILITRFKNTYGVINKTFFYKRKDGSKIEIKGIPFQDDKKSLNPKEIYAFYGNSATITFPKFKDTIGVEIVAICTPNDFNTVSKELFVKNIMNVAFSPNDVNYTKLNQLRKLSDSY